MQYHQFSILMTERASLEEFGNIIGEIYKVLEKEESLVTIDVVASEGCVILLNIGFQDISVDDIRLKVIESFGNTSLSADNFMLV